MCFNENVSIGTYILGLVGCYNLYMNTNYKVEAIFFAWVVQMQLIEFFLWKNQSCNDLNKQTSKIGLIINHLEPVILWVAILLLSSKELPLYVNVLMTGFVIITILYTKYILDKSDETKCSLVTPESKPHIEWKWNNQKYNNIYYVLFLLCLNVVSINGVEHGYHLASILTISLLISIAIYSDKKVTGSMWCFLAAFLPWIIPVVYEIKLEL